MRQRLSVLLGIVLVFWRIAFAQDYEIYVFNHPFSGKVVSKQAKVYVELQPLAKAMGIEVQNKQGEIYIAKLDKPFSDAFQGDDKHWYVALKSFVEKSGNKFIVNGETKIIDILPGNSTLSQKEVDTLSKKSLEQVSTVKGFLVYDNPEERITFRYPSSWQKIETSQGYTAVFRLSSESGSQENVNLITGNFNQPALPDLNAFIQGYIAESRSKYHRLMEILQSSEISIDNHPSREIVFLTERSGTKLQILQTFSANADKIYMLSYAARTQQFEKYLPGVQEMIGSIRFSSSQQKTGFMIFEDSAAGVKFKYPASWRRFDHFHGSVVAFTGLGDCNSSVFVGNLNIVVASLPSQSLSLDQYVEASIQQLKKDFPAINILESTSATLAGLPGNRLVWSGKTSSGEVLKRLQLSTINNGKEYVVTYGAPRDNYDQCLSGVEEVARSFEIK